MMSSKTFFYSSLFLGISLFALFVVFNIQYDIYGLHQQDNLKNKRIYFNEGFSKFLLSKNYIPNNFNGIITGPSLSDNINSEDFKSLDLYNLSFMGARMDDLNILIQSAISKKDSKVKTVIISISPYLTELNSNQISDLSEYAYKESFGSYGLIKTYMIAGIRYFNLMPNKYPKHQFSSYGFNNYNKLFEVENIEYHITNKAIEEAGIKLKVDQISLAELTEIRSFLKYNGISFLIYFHPIPRNMFLANLSQYDEYKENVLEIFDHDEINFIDFNTEEYSYITSDYTNYIDHGHLSKKGQLEVLRVVENLYQKTLNLF